MKQTINANVSEREYREYLTNIKEKAPDFPKDIVRVRKMMEKYQVGSFDQLEDKLDDLSDDARGLKKYSEIQSDLNCMYRARMIEEFVEMIGQFYSSKDANIFFDYFVYRTSMKEIGKKYHLAVNTVWRRCHSYVAKIITEDHFRGIIRG